ncbi:MAG TPA: V-type ATP synthase subunit A [Haploplasma sp.]|nr:V-type ATP synthase subunit A [Haploplasma sp.]
MSKDNNNEVGIITKVSGPLIVAKNMSSVQVYDVVKVSNRRLTGEVIELRGDLASIQVYEETAGIGPGEPVYFTNQVLSVELGPGLIGGIFDGIQRPLEEIYKVDPQIIPAGIEIPSLDRNKEWDFEPVVKVDDFLVGGDVIGLVDESNVVKHKVMVPPNISGKVTFVKKGLSKVADTVVKLEDKNGKVHELNMIQYWPVRTKRPYKKKITPNRPMITGQRVIDTLFPIAIGGVAAIPGPFGSGKTVVQHQLAKWSDADIIVYVGCGERGNEMTDVLMEFPELKDPQTGESLMERTILIANTSNMPVAAREASIYTGITIAEYYRDMGYKVAIMADSTSRWAEALREMSSRLEEMPGEEGYPAYLSSKLAEFYERAGLVKTLGSSDEEGAVTVIGAVSPPGGDTSEPVSQATLRIVKVFWGLSSQLAYRRHFPAIDWLKSYSLYQDQVGEYFDDEVESNWTNQVNRVKAMLQDEEQLEEIVRLVGLDSLSKEDQTKLLASQMIREDFLHQNAFDDIDTYSSTNKQYQMINVILTWYDQAVVALANGLDYKLIEESHSKNRIGRLKYVEEDSVDKEVLEIIKDIEKEFKTGGIN